MAADTSGRLLHCLKRTSKLPGFKSFPSCLRASIGGMNRKTTTSLQALVGALLIVGTGALSASAAPVSAARQLGGVCADCDFSRQRLSESPISGNFPRSRFDAAVLTDAQLRGNFANAVFASADMREATVHSANASHADFSRADLRDVKVTRSNLSHSVFDKSRASDARIALSSLSHSSFVEVAASNIEFRNVAATHSRFTASDLREARFDSSNLAHSQFRDCNLSDARFTGSNLDGADFAGADLSDAMFEGATLRGAQLARAKGLQSDSLRNACGDARTTVPAHMTRPPECGTQSRRMEHTRVVVSGPEPTQIFVNKEALRPALEEARREARAALAEARQDGVLVIGDLDATIQEALATAFSALRELDGAEVVIEQQIAREVADEEAERAEAEARRAMVEQERDLRIHNSATRREIAALQRAIRDSRDPQVRAAFEQRLMVLTGDMGNGEGPLSGGPN